MRQNKRKLFCEISPTTYAISLQKEICKRHIKNLISDAKIAKVIQKDGLPNVVSSHSSNLIKKGVGIEPKLQENKVTNIELACSKISGILIHPGEVFSFWQLVGKITKKKGYLHGRVIQRNIVQPGIGGGLCNLGNTINWLVLHSPLDVVEFHSHSDALAPDEGERAPFTSGTSVFYNNIDYRFKNNTDQVIQLLVWCDDEKLHGEIRSEKDFPWQYKLIEENHRFEKEEEKYYRLSKIYKETVEKSTGNILEKKLILDNHSEVMFDYSLIPKDQIVELA